MGQKVNPNSFRLGIIKDWNSKWFNQRSMADLLRDDHLIRNHIEENLANASVERVLIERGPNLINIIIRTSKPGIIVGRGGSGIEELKKNLSKKVKTPIRLEVQEIRNPDAYAKLVAQNIAEQIERRMPFRRVLKQALERVTQNKDIAGAKIQISGRLGGANMSRREWVSKGKIPLQTLQANIDFAKVIAKTNCGIIGIKVWLYKPR